MNPVRPQGDFRGVNPLGSTRRRLLTRSDSILILGIFFISVASLFLIRSGSRVGEEVIIEYDGGVIKRHLSLSEEFELEGPLGVSIAKIEGGKVRMTTSPCPAKTCVRTGWISKKGETVVCIPNHIVIRIKGIAKEEYDAISR